MAKNANVLSRSQRAENGLDLNDIEVSIRQNIDSTGLVCKLCQAHWTSALSLVSLLIPFPL